MWQHLSSFARRVQERSCPVRLLLHPGFDWMNDDWSPVTDYSFSARGMGSATQKALAFLWFNPWKLQSLFRNHPPAALLLVSWHPLNFLVAQLAKSMYPDIPVITWLHEPYKDEKGIYGAKALIIWLVELCQTLSLRYTDSAILHSRRGLRLFEKRYPGFPGTRRVIPLHFQDGGLDTGVERRYVSFLGRADKAKGIDLFFELVETLAPRNTGYEFQIATSSNIQSYLKGLSPVSRSRLKVINKPRLSDKELRDAAANSLAVLALYQETMQSGIIPVALMKGTPVIGTDIEGINEWIRDRETGVIVPRDPSTADIEAAISFIEKKLPVMSPLCRDYYLATFDDLNWDRDYGWLREFLPLRNGSIRSS